LALNPACGQKIMFVFFAWRKQEKISEK
jgi:hypothetical protein